MCTYMRIVVCLIDMYTVCALICILCVFSHKRDQCTHKRDLDRGIHMYTVCGLRYSAVTISRLDKRDLCTHKRDLCTHKRDLDLGIHM